MCWRSRLIITGNVRRATWFSEWWSPPVFMPPSDIINNDMELEVNKFDE